jgi:glycosyltransferase involved in cell wall biosynthesis
MIKLSVIIPCYNEASAIKLLIDKCRNANNNRKDIEFILVDNGSTDTTSVIIKELLINQDLFFIKLVTVKNNIGYGNGIIQGLKAASGEILSFTHADLQCDPKDAVLAYDQYKDKLGNNLCVVKGRRTNRGVFDNFFTWAMSVFSSWTLGVQLSDVNAQPKMFHRQFYESLHNPPLDFSLDLFILYSARKKNIPIIDFPVLFSKRHSGVAKGGGSLKGKWKLIKRTYRYIIQLRTEVKRS